MAGEVGRASRAARPGSKAGAANLLSLLLCASVQVVGRIKLGLHSLIIYPGKQGKLVNPEGFRRPRGQRCFPGAWGPGTSFLYRSCEVRGRNRAQEHCFLLWDGVCQPFNLGSFSFSICKMGSQLGPVI